MLLDWQVTLCMTLVLIGGETCEEKYSLRPATMMLPTTLEDSLQSSFVERLYYVSLVVFHLHVAGLTALWL